MLNESVVKAQARRLVALLAAQPKVQYQDALSILAQLNGFRDWKTLSAQLKREDSKATAPTPAKAPQPQGLDLAGDYGQKDIPGVGYLYRVPVSVDTSMTAVVLARGETKDEAIEAARRLASEGKVRFEVDDGNYRGYADHYCPDDSADGTFLVPEPQDSAWVDLGNGGIQLGAFRVEVADLGDQDDELLWADLTVYDPSEAAQDPDSPPEAMTSCLSSCSRDASVAQRQAFCLRVARLLHDNVPDVSQIDHGMLRHVFIQATQGDTSEAAYAALAKKLQGALNT